MENFIFCAGLHVNLLTFDSDVLKKDKGKGKNKINKNRNSKIVIRKKRRKIFTR